MALPHTHAFARLALGATTLALMSPVLMMTPASYAASCNAPDPRTAVLSVDETTPVLPGEQIHLTGSGFEPGQRLAVKMDHDAYGQIGADPAENAAEATRERILVEADGTFSAEPVTVPRYQRDGKATEAMEHTINLLDNAPVTTVCTRFETAAAYTTSVDSSAVSDPGDVVTVSGTGWNNRAGTASSTIGVVVEEAGTSGIVASERPAAHRPHSNARIWAVVPVEAFSGVGTFSIDVRLPDGTTQGPGGSTVAFGGKDYRVRLWSGAQLGNESDISRNVVVPGDFAVSPPPQANTPSEPNIPVARQIKNKKKPVLRGNAKVGKSLKVTQGRWNPRKVTLTYQWLRNGKAIRGATKSKHKVTRRDKGKKLKVRITAAKAGWQARTVRTKAVKIRKK